MNSQMAMMPLPNVAKSEEMMFMLLNSQINYVKFSIRTMKHFNCSQKSLIPFIRNPFSLLLIPSEKNIKCKLCKWRCRGNQTYEFILRVEDSTSHLILDECVCVCLFVCGMVSALMDVCGGYKLMINNVDKSFASFRLQCLCIFEESLLFKIAFKCTLHKDMKTELNTHFAPAQSALLLPFLLVNFV